MTLAQLNALTFEDAAAELQRCCGSRQWAEGVARARPFRDEEHLYTEAARRWEKAGPADWHEAFSHHPRIGDVSKLRERFAQTASWSSQEQQGVSAASEETLRELAEGNGAYEEKFGHLFLVCATGKSAAELLALLRERMNNAPDHELRVACAEQAKITRIRLEKLLSS
ncbi:MAG: 2-oxo-4-hydroxy-4-carboxy-5-ureidoimidazoline decarboxylase [Myxococcota bacterium]